MSEEKIQARTQGQAKIPPRGKQTLSKQSEPLEAPSPNEHFNSKRMKVWIGPLGLPSIKHEKENKQIGSVSPALRQTSGSLKIYCTVTLRGLKWGGEDPNHSFLLKVYPEPSN